ncbi:MAG: HipA domain-containing protein [Proteobacteria bacterium]|nr:HipA domain-containing protein [Pseudomonadota bacterium]
MTSECYVYIVLPGETAFVTAGRFTLRETREGANVGEFIYVRSYRERANAVALDPVNLRLQPGKFETAMMDGFFGAIRDAMPDAWGRKVMDRHVGGQMSPFDYLLRAPDDRAGALGFGRNTEPPFPENEFNRTLDLERLQQAADALIKGDPDLAGSVGQQTEDLLMLGGTSMGGARPKAVVEDGNALWVAKFVRTDDNYNQPRTEHALLQLARQCGLDAADSRLTTVAGRDVLLVRRFDRDRTDDGYRRHRMVSAVTLLRTDDDPTTRRDWSYLLLADEIRRVSADPQEDLRELYRRMVFNAAVSNLDDHPRNHAVLARENTWRLSPAYDLTPFAVISQERSLALDCGLHGRGANKANLVSGHGRFMLEREEATEIFDSIVETVRDEWEPALRRAGVGAAECEQLGRAFVYEGLFFEKH